MHLFETKTNFQHLKLNKTHQQTTAIKKRRKKFLIEKWINRRALIFIIVAIFIVFEIIKNLSA